MTVFDDFCHANDPYEEHDFGAFDADGQLKSLFNSSLSASFIRLPHRQRRVAERDV
jgi:hypothetical protein